MTTPFFIKDQATVRDDFLRTIKNGMIARGVENPQVSPGSDYFVLATAVSNEVTVVGSNTQVKGDSKMADTAQDSDLDAVCAPYGIVRGVATSSEGFVVIQTSSPTFIPVGQQLVDSAGLRYQVTLGGTYTNTAPNNSVPISAVDTGAATNHLLNDVLRWTAVPAYTQQVAFVGAGGLEGGLDAENDEDLRARLLSRLQNPPNNGNWSQIAVITEASDSAVQKAFVYPAANGPSTVHIAVTAAAQVLSASVTALTSTSKRRSVAGAIMTSKVIPYIQGQLPEYVESTITTVSNLPNDVAVGLSLPASPAAVPAGPGGGWVDGTPWPQPDKSTFFFCQVLGTASSPAALVNPTSTVFTVQASAAPTINVSHIAMLDPVNWQLYRAKVLAVDTSGLPSNCYAITVDTPFPNIAVNNYIWPDCVNAQVYIDATLSAFASMGPGEKTSPPGNIARAYRHPIPANSWPYSLGAPQLRSVTDADENVLQIAYLFRTTDQPPPVSVSVNNPPTIFIPRQIGFYPL